MFWLDLQLLRRSKVESVRLLGNSGIASERFRERYGAMIGYTTAALALYTTTTQFISIGFAPSIPWDSPGWVKSLMGA